MKYMVLLLAVFVSLPGLAQQTKAQVFISDEVISVNLDDDNSSRILSINASQFSNNDVLKIRVENDLLARDWDRRFFIYDSTGNPVKDFVKLNDGSDCIKFSDLKQLLYPRKEYYIYTTAVPTDTQKAMMVKMGRTLVCKIKIL